MSIFDDPHLYIYEQCADLREQLTQRDKEIASLVNRLERMEAINESLREYASMVGETLVCEFVEGD